MLNIKQISSFLKAIKAHLDGMQTRPRPFNYVILQEECNSVVTKIKPTLLAFSL